MVELLAEQKNIEHGICANGCGAQALHPREKRRRYCHRWTLQVSANPAQWPSVCSKLRGSWQSRMPHAGAGAITKKNNKTLASLWTLIFIALTMPAIFKCDRLCRALVCRGQSAFSLTPGEFNGNSEKNCGEKNRGK
ncbi:hypothetical protein [Vandammella animalimorsus]|uniref:hypothetical protein n=1 Tax=Vandammella animalimorsus TaxID=2029117 RepID=UPI0015524618|nr:hypothetical protein [Vandammella animalimorsus]